MIMTHHLVLADIPAPYPAAKMGWIYVEFFLIISGYFTFMHFEKIEGTPRDAVSYFVQKLKALIPYTTVAIIVAYLITFFLGGEEMSFFDILTGIPLDLTFVSLDPIVDSLWYMTALFIAFPLFALLMEIKDKGIVFILSFTYTAVYYVYFFEERMHSFNAVIRVFAGLMLGAVLGSVTYFVSLHDKHCHKLFLTIIESVCMLFCILIVWTNREVDLRLIIVLFAFGCWIMLSGYSYTDGVRSRILDFLGTISVPMFIWNPVVAKGVSIVLRDAAPGVRVFWFYIVTIAVSVLSLMLTKLFFNKGDKQRMDHGGMNEFR